MLELRAFIHEACYIERKLFTRCNGVRHEIEIGYWWNGSIHYLQHQRNGVRHGIEIDYWLNGSIQGLRHWYNGKKIEINYA